MFTETHAAALQVTIIAVAVMLSSNVVNAVSAETAASRFCKARPSIGRWMSPMESFDLSETSVLCCVIVRFWSMVATRNALSKSESRNWSYWRMAG
jgi:hypothetical protein